MSKTIVYDVLRGHEGDRYYREGDEREMSSADADHLVKLKVLRPTDKKPKSDKAAVADSPALDKAKAVLSEVSAKIEAAKDEHKLLVDQISSFKSDLSGFTSQIETAKSSLADLTTQVEAKKNELAQIEASKNDLVGLEGQIGAAKDALSQLDGKVLSKKDELAALETDIAGKLAVRDGAPGDQTKPEGKVSTKPDASASTKS